jgi:hypothetical protein
MSYEEEDTCMSYLEEDSIPSPGVDASEVKLMCACVRVCVCACVRVRLCVCIDAREVVFQLILESTLSM